MDIMHRIETARNLTPTEQQVATTALAMANRLKDYGIKEFARAARVSIPSVHRFCKKIGLEGFKELKIEIARAEAFREGQPRDFNINFPFTPQDDGSAMLGRMSTLYDATLRDTRALLDAETIDEVAALIANAEHINIYTQSHNLYPAQMFCGRLLSCGFFATCYDDLERQVWAALGSTERDVSVLISYSGMGPNLSTIVPILTERNVPSVLIGTSRAQRLNPALSHYLYVSDLERPQDRIAQFASHIAVQYVLDVLFCCAFTHDWDSNMAALASAIPYTKLTPGLHRFPGAPNDMEFLDSPQ